MKIKTRIYLILAFVLILLLSSVSCTYGDTDINLGTLLEFLEEVSVDVDEDDEIQENPISENGSYTSKDDVALYIHTYGKLPSNYITKKEAQSEGWISGKNTLDEILPGRSIGGDHFGNYEGLLPAKEGRTYKECDIDYIKGGRNEKRIVYSNDGLIFYTDDHYASFEQLY